MNWPASIRRRFVRLAEEVIELDGDQDEAPSLAAMAHDARELLAKTTAERARSARVRVKASPRVAAKAEKRKTNGEARRSTRPIVEARANGQCEAGLSGCRGALHWDHFFGRGKVPPSVELEWMLCEEHDHQKTENQPSRLYWLGVFERHAMFYVYADAIDRCEKAIAIEIAQHGRAA